MSRDAIELLLRINTKLDKLADELDGLKIANASLPCSINDRRLKLLERAVFGLIGAIVLMFIADTGNSNKAINKVKHVAVAQEIVKDEMPNKPKEPIKPLKPVTPN